MRTRTASKRDAIVAAAAAVFGEMGYTRASMQEIAARVGGSKATLYGYFASKDALFVEVILGAAKRQMEPAFAELDAASGTLPATLRSFGERMLAFTSSQAALRAERMVIGEAGNSGIGRTFFDAGPKQGDALLAAFLGRAMDAGQLRRADPLVAAQHLVALMGAETHFALLCGAIKTVTRQRIREVVDRAVAVFMTAYAA